MNRAPISATILTAMRAEKEQRHNIDSDQSENAKQEPFFELPLKALACGLDGSGAEIREYTELSSISSQVATFWLKSKVKRGTRLRLSLEVPRTPVLENFLKLQISGKVFAIEDDGGRKNKKLVSMHLDKSFKILPFFP